MHVEFLQDLITTQLQITPFASVSLYIWCYSEGVRQNGERVSIDPSARYGEGSNHSTVFIIQTTSALDRFKWGAVRCGMARRTGKANFCNWWAAEGPLVWGHRLREFNPPVHQLRPLSRVSFFGSPIHYAQWILLYVDTRKSRSDFFFMRRIWGELGESCYQNRRETWERKRNVRNVIRETESE